MKTKGRLKFGDFEKTETGNVKIEIGQKAALEVP
jgi:hypothetical protein